MGLKEKYKVTRKLEEQEAYDQQVNEAVKAKRRLQLASRMQACIRGWLTRKRIVQAMDNRIEFSAWLNKLPELLQSQLSELQHEVHDLLYDQEDKESSATKIQGWWRCILAQRAMAIIRCNEALGALFHQMNSAAIVIQAWYRGQATKACLRNKIQAKLREAGEEKMKEMQWGLKCVIHIQRRIREKQARTAMRILAQKSVKDLTLPFTTVHDTQAGEDENEILVDTWRPQPVIDK